MKLYHDLMKAYHAWQEKRHYGLYLKHGTKKEKHAWYWGDGCE